MLPPGNAEDCKRSRNEAKCNYTLSGLDTLSPAST
jgi:hypothetical protein